MGLFSNLLGGGAAKKASKKAAKAQIAGMEKGIGEQRDIFGQIQGWYDPYQTTGSWALGQYGGLLGQGGPEAQQAAIDQLKNSPFYQSLYRTGEEALLQNASATGGLRGGNTQRGLADFGADTLAKTIQQQLGYLGGLTQMGERTAGNLAQAGLGTSGNITDLLVGQGQAKAQDILTRGMINQNMWNNIGGLMGSALNFAMPGVGSAVGSLFGGGGGAMGGGGIPGGGIYGGVDPMFLGGLPGGGQ